MKTTRFFLIFSFLLYLVFPGCKKYEIESTDPSVNTSQIKLYDANQNAILAPTLEVPYGSSFFLEWEVVGDVTQFEATLDGEYLSKDTTGSFKADSLKADLQFVFTGISEGKQIKRELLVKAKKPVVYDLPSLVLYYDSILYPVPWNQDLVIHYQTFNTDTFKVNGVNVDPKGEAFVIFGMKKDSTLHFELIGKGGKATYTRVIRVSPEPVITNTDLLCQSMGWKIREKYTKFHIGDPYTKYNLTGSPLLDLLRIYYPTQIFNDYSQSRGELIGEDSWEFSTVGDRLQILIHGSDGIVYDSVRITMDTLMYSVEEFCYGCPEDILYSKYILTKNTTPLKK